MNYFWGNVFEHFKERRYAAVFFITLAAVFGGLALGAIFCKIAVEENLLQYWPMTVPGLGLVLLALGWRWIRERRVRRLNRYKSSPLSRDEWVKARAKLARKSVFK